MTATAIPADGLQAIEAALWQELLRASQDREHEWRVGVLATADGDLPDARSVVLREVDVARRNLLIFTDARSPKVRQIEQQAAGVLVLWSKALSWQLRLKLRLSVCVDGLAVSSRWASLKLTPSAQDYLSPLPPGSTLDPQQAMPSPPRQSRGHFAVLAAEVVGIDWLELGCSGQRRAVFDRAGQGRWVAP
jgi:hypothetical protein